MAFTVGGDLYFFTCLLLDVLSGVLDMGGSKPCVSLDFKGLRDTAVFRPSLKASLVRSNEFFLHSEVD